MDLRALDELRALDRRDRELSDRAAQLRALQEGVAAVRGRAEEIDAFFVAYPAAEDCVRRIVAAAEVDLAARRAEVADAETERERAKDANARESAERAVARARDHVQLAAARVERAVAERDALERDASALPGELPELSAAASRIAEALAEGEPPAAGPRELVEWAARAQASLFVAAGQIDAQRDRVIREANELATMLLGEPTYGATPAQARARVEATLR
jgi:chromosome segregation ATPase